MKLPRDLSGEELIKALKTFGYQVSRQTGSHVRLTTNTPSEHHLTIPAHRSLRIGTLAAIVQDVATHLKQSREDVQRKLFGR